MATKPSKTAVEMVLALTDYSEQVTIANYQERLELNIILEIEADATILDTHFAARDRKMAEALVNEHGVDLALDGDAWRLNIGAATKDDLVECITAAIERAREEVGE